MNPLVRPLVVLGATGSIGRQALEVAARIGAQVVGLASRSPGPAVAEAAEAFPEAQVAVAGGSSEERDALRSRLGPDRVRFGPDAVLELAAVAGVTVLNAIVGAVGLEASAVALEAGNRLALANKESLVTGGPVLMRLAGASGELIPVDSEHSALHQLLSGLGDDEMTGVVLTASGGPFRGRSREELEDVTVEEALRHPVWEMGRRITIDSATLANKGLEVIEAHYLFGLPYDRIEVVVHPQSIVHGMVRLVDGGMIAHLGTPDMRIPIQYALTYPGRVDSPVAPFDPVGATLTFEAPDLEAFPALALAYEAGRRGGGSPAVYNAADEVAVEAFATGRLGFLGIAEVIARTLAEFDPPEPRTVAEALEIDRTAREIASSLIGGQC
jgi:1-deoxy-D-xylulose-5-phosphate reductoisomerase